jgi:hypothetical protein
MPFQGAGAAFWPGVVGYRLSSLRMTGLDISIVWWRFVSNVLTGEDPSTSSGQAARRSIEGK